MIQSSKEETEDRQSARGTTPHSHHRQLAEFGLQEFDELHVVVVKEAMVDVAVVAAESVVVVTGAVDDNAPTRRQWTKANGLALRRPPLCSRAAPLVLLRTHQIGITTGDNSSSDANTKEPPRLNIHQQSVSSTGGSHRRLSPVAGNAGTHGGADGHGASGGGASRRRCTRRGPERWRKGRQRI